MHYLERPLRSDGHVVDVDVDGFAALEAGEILLSSQQEMQRRIAEDKAYIARRYPGGLRYAHELESFPYIKFLERERKASKQRWARGAIKDRRVVLANRSAEPRRPDLAAASS
jgi:hypothetical protein